MKITAIVGKMSGVILLLLAPAIAQTQGLKVTLLGTGNPSPRMDRFGPSILVEAGAEKMLFDCGRGATQRLFQLQIPLKEVNPMFLTHLHSDHVVGIPDMWLTGWFNGREVPLQVSGPNGTTRMMSHLGEAYAFDVRVRLSSGRPSPNGAVILAHDITEGVAYEQNGVKVTAFDVDHGPVKPALGYRIDYEGRSVVLSGDTRFSENLIRFSKGVDLLIHEVLVGEGRGQEYHTSTEQAAEVFMLVKPTLAVYSHILPPGAKAGDLIAATRKTYAGRVEVGEDLMIIEVGEEIQVRRFSR